VFGRRNKIQLAEIDKLDEIRDRLVNIESKLNLSLGIPDRRVYAAINEGFGHSDQLYGCVTFSQSADDMIAVGVFDTLGIKNPSYLDIGAHHPVHISNTYLLYLRGSRGINVEANPALIKPFNEIRPEDINLNIGVSDKVGRMTFFRFGETSGLNTFNPNRAEYVEKELGFPVIDRIDIDVTTVSEIVSKHWGGEFPDYLSLDVEGLDYAILNSIDYARSSPKLVSVEANDGEAVTTITELMIRKGYHPHFRIRGNLLFLRKDCKAAMFPE
jgi:FkbM family methyltransferase